MTNNTISSLDVCAQWKTENTKISSIEWKLYIWFVTKMKKNPTIKNQKTNNKRKKKPWVTASTLVYCMLWSNLIKSEVVVVVASRRFSHQ